MKKGLDYHLATFTPAEAERITGLSRDMQRDWRRRGYVPSYEKHARFDPFELSTLWTMKLLADAGKGPAEVHSMTLVAEVAAAIVYTALRWEGSEYSITPADLGPVFDRLNQQSKIPVKAMPEDDRPELFFDYDKREAIAKTVLIRERQPIIEARELTWWPTSEFEFDGYSGAIERGQIKDQDRFVGAVLLLDIATLGYALAKRAGKPLLTLVEASA